MALRVWRHDGEVLGIEEGLRRDRFGHPRDRKHFFAGGVSLHKTMNHRIMKEGFQPWKRHWHPRTYRQQRIVICCGGIRFLLADPFHPAGPGGLWPVPAGVPVHSAHQHGDSHLYHLSGPGPV